jgi:MFS family permease
MGYILMAVSLSHARSEDPIALSRSTWTGATLIPPEWAFLASYFFLAGSATAASYFAAVSTATKSFGPSHSGLAIGISSALFGASPIVLSATASWFTDADGDLRAVQFMLFLAGLLGIVNLIGAIGLRVPAVEEDDEHEPATDPSEASPLVPDSSVVVVVEDTRSLSAMVSLSSFWAFGVGAPR